MGTASTKKFLKQSGGVLYEEAALTTSAGEADANKIPSPERSRPTATITTTAMAANAAIAAAGAGTSSSTAVICSEGVKAGDYINMWSNASIPTARLAVATAVDRQAMGFASADAATGTPVAVQLIGMNTLVADQSIGNVFLSTTPSKGTATPPSQPPPIAIPPNPLEGRVIIMRADGQLIAIKR